MKEQNDALFELLDALGKAIKETEENISSKINLIFLWKLRVLKRLMTLFQKLALQSRKSSKGRPCGKEHQGKLISASFWDLL